MNNEYKFDYIYTAPTESERKEIESIKKQYEPITEKEENINKLRNLNNRVKRVPLVISILLGIFGMLIMGLGMALVMEWSLMLWGIIIGIIGVAVAAAAYPVYKAALNFYKSKYGQQIIDLSNKLLNYKDQ